MAPGRAAPPGAVGCYGDGVGSPCWKAAQHPGETHCGDPLQLHPTARTRSLGAHLGLRAASLPVGRVTGEKPPGPWSAPAAQEAAEEPAAQRPLLRVLPAAPPAPRVPRPGQAGRLRAAPRTGGSGAALPGGFARSPPPAPRRPLPAPRRSAERGQCCRAEVAGGRAGSPALPAAPAEPGGRRPPRLPAPFPLRPAAPSRRSRVPSPRRGFRRVQRPRCP